MEFACTRTEQCSPHVSKTLAYMRFLRLYDLTFFYWDISDVDRLPLVSSCIIQVAQDIDEPWPIEVYDHAGKAYNVTMQPGEMVLYESHTVLHGRPFPMKGRTYVSFVGRLCLRACIVVMIKPFLTGFLFHIVGECVCSLPTCGPRDHE